MGLSLASFLLTGKLLTEQQIEQAQGHMQQKRCSFEEAILDLQLLSRSQLYGTIADQFRVPYADLEDYLPDPRVRDLVPIRLVRQHRALPLFRIQNSLIVAMVDPTDLGAIDALQRASGCLIEAYLSSGAEIAGAIERVYGAQGEAERYLEELAGAPGSPAKAQVPEQETEAPIARLVDTILTNAIRDRASDIHIEPEEDFLRIRLRIDGILHEIPSPPKSFEPALISRLKVLGNMDIAESRIPQDGHCQVKTDNRLVDIRISTLPTVNGENVVLRLLDPSGLFLRLEQLGLGPEAVRKLDKALYRSYGLILAVGPTGHGKTTTLYSSLMKISSIHRNIVTIEDPVEYRLGLIRQVQVNPKAGVTFAVGLRAILRQDPDIIMVGEIRDKETAQIAIQAALTGHLVLSTLHTNDAASTVTRLVDMGVEPFLVSAALICVVSPRLVRTICDSCKTWYEPPPAFLQRLPPGLKEKVKQPLKIAKGMGCPQCKGTGYRGRIGIYELMALDEDLREMVLSSSSALALREAACAKGMKLVWEEGMVKVLEGVTTPEEVARVAEDQTDTDTPVEAKMPGRGSEPNG